MPYLLCQFGKIRGCTLCPATYSAEYILKSSLHYSRKLVILTKEDPSDSERAKQSHLRLNIISLKSSFPANSICLRKTTRRLYSPTCHFEHSEKSHNKTQSSIIYINLWIEMLKIFILNTKLL